MVAMTFQRGGPGGGRGRGRGAEPAGVGIPPRSLAAGSRAPQTYEEYERHALQPIGSGYGSPLIPTNRKWVNDLKNDPEAGYKRAEAPPSRKSPRIDGYDFSKCLMDGGASLNIMYLETLERMNLTKEQLKHSTTEFHGVVPELLPRHLRQATYHKFHARACYIYNKLKIPGPKELKGYRAAVDPTEMQTTKKQISEQKTSFKPAIETKKHDLIPATNKVVSLVIVVERKEEGHEYDVRRPVYYISEVIVSKAPLSTILNNTDATGRTAKWGIELSAFDIAQAKDCAGTWNARNSVMAAYGDEVDEIAKSFLGYEVKYVRRDDNTAADMLSKLGSGRKPIPLAFSWSISGYPRLRR
ncbi:hypothetical protein QYE76_060107 [Lolium multiflorum]|uniref:Uncharacterized protein n=1 Tax=Lolium multiflorum TaxID=4521 RepID=A0AAD8W674_LOLMU|nr:hypothetical protein QYE76_060107 [Lolium multiflorum]